jgi:hypothetical protein
MAIVEYTFFSSLRNSVGGATFYNNSNGNIMRIKNRNTKTNSISQINSRSLFNNSHGGYAQLSAGDKSAWNSWAISNWHSIRNTESANRSGYLAYRSCRNSLSNANSKHLTPTCNYLPAVTLASITEAAFVFVSPPTGLHISNSIIDAPGSSYQLIVLNVTLTSAGVLQFDFQFGVIPHVLTVNGQLQDSNSQRFGVSVFCSDSGNSINFKPKVQLYKSIFCTENITFGVPGLTGSSGVRFNVNVLPNLLNSKFSLVAGKYYYLTFVNMGLNGTQSIISKVCVLCS